MKTAAIILTVSSIICSLIVLLLIRFENPKEKISRMFYIMIWVPIFSHIILIGYIIIMIGQTKTYKKTIEWLEEEI